MVGTRVRERRNDHAIDNMTATAMGTKRKRATPSRKNIGTKTMQMHSSETNAGVAICVAPSMMAVSTSLPSSKCRLMLSMVTVASSTRMPTASASPPRVMILRVSPSAARQMIAPRIDSGIDTATITVERQLPRNNNIMILVSTAAMAPSNATPLIAARTNKDWSLIGTTWRLAGKAGLISASFDRMPATMASVEVMPFFSTVITTERVPSTCTMLVCGALPSRTCATSRI